MIRKVLLTTVAIAATAGTAFAADLPSRRAPPVFVPPPIPVFTWSGFYIGGQIGYEFGATNASFFAPRGPVIGPFQVGQTGAVIGGVHAGYNYQFGGLGASGLVAGLEFDLEGSNNTSSQGFANGALLQHAGNIEGSARGRLGFAVDRALFYVTGGAAFAQFKDKAFIPQGNFAFSTTRVGWTAGAGAEYAVTPAFSLRGEYRYSDFGSYTNSLAPVLPNAVERNRVTEQKVEVGFSYHFADVIPAPVVAKY